MADGIRVELELDDGSFQTKIIRANNTLAQFQQQVGARTIDSVRLLNQETRGFLETLRDVTIVTEGFGMAFEGLHRIAGGWIGDIVAVNKQVDNLTIQLAGLSSAADPLKDATQELKNLRATAQNAPFSLEAMHQAFVRMKIGGIDPTKGAMQGLIDAVAHFGGTDAQIASASLALQEMSGKGVVQLKELRNQLGMAIPGSIQVMARSFGVSYEELMKDVHTGAVDATAAISSMVAEFDRAFGGEAQNRMESYTGQLARTQAIMQTLALRAGGEIGSGGFFDTLKDQIKDLNDALAGGIGNNIADALGSGLKTALLDLRQGVNLAIQFRSEIVGLGEALAIGFGGKLAISSIGGLLGGIANLRAQLRGLSIEWEMAAAASNLTMPSLQPLMTALAGPFRNAIVGASMNLTLLRGSLSGLSGGFSAAGAGIMAVARFLPVITSGFALVAPWLPLIAGGIYLIGDHFGWFSNKAKEAWQEMQNFGAHTKEQVDLGAQYIQQLQKQLDVASAPRGRFQIVNKGQVDDLTKQLDDAKKAQEGFAQQFQSSEVDKFAKTQGDETLAQETRIRAAYRVTTAQQEEAYRAQRKAVIDAGHSTMAVDLAYRDQVKATSVELYDDVISVYETRAAKLKELLATGDETQRQGATKALDDLDKKTQEQLAKRAEAMQAPGGVPVGKKALDDVALFNKGQQTLEKLQSQVVGLQAAFSGADEGAAALDEEMKRLNQFGDWESIARVRELMSEITATKEQVDLMNEALSGKNKLDGDLRSLGTKLDEEYLEITTRGLSAVDKMRVALHNGMYAGFGDATSPAQQRIIDIRKSLTDTTGAAQTVGDIIRNETFGQKVMTSASGFLDVLNRISGVMGGLKGQAAGTNLSSVFGVGSGLTAFGLSGPTAGGGGSYMNNLIHTESGGDSSAQSSTSTAAGLGQFTEATWIDFIRAAHPEQLAFGRTYVLGLRNNPDMQKEAISWLAAKNASILASRGLPTTDSNVYLGHFLGGNTAANALSAPSGTPLTDLLGAGQINANPFLRNWTNDQLSNWSQSKFGTGSTWQGTGGPGVAPIYPNDSRGGTPNNVTPEVAATLSDDDIKTQRNNQAKVQADLEDRIKQLDAAILKANEIQSNGGKAVAEEMARITQGIEDPSNKDPNSPQFADILAKAKALDDANFSKDAAEKKRTAAASSTETVQKLISDLQAERDEALQQLANPNDPRFSSDSLRNQKTLRDNENKQIAAHGANSPEADAASDASQDVTDQLRDRDLVKSAAALQQKTQQLKESLQDQDTAQNEALDRMAERYKRDLASFSGTEEEKARLSKILSANLAANQAEAFAKTPIGSELKNWQDLGKNIETTMAGAMSSVTSNLASAMTGTRVNWRSMLTSMSKDMLQAALQFGVSSIAGGAKGGVGAVAKGAGGGGGLFGSIFSGLGSLFGIKHTGGIVGALGGSSRYVNPAVFMNAPKFHSGGIIGSDEVPIIARRGEGVFTPEQMAGMGGGNGGVTLHNNVTVNANGGTSAQNDDLAKQVSSQMEKSARGLIADQLRQQMRPGNLLHR